MISIRIDKQLLRTVDIAGAAERRERSEVISEALEAWLKRRALAEKVQHHRADYARHPVSPDEFVPLLKVQIWPR